MSWPTDEAGHRLTGQPGDAVMVTWTTEWGVHEVAGTIADTRTEPVPLWSLRALMAPPAHQRRDAFRLEVRLPLELRTPAAVAVRTAATAGQARTAAPAPGVEATVVDLSEGGLGFSVAAEAAVELGTALEATFPLDDGDITLAATVVRLGEATGGERSGGMRFDGMTEEAATRLRRYVLNEQIRRRCLVRD